MHVSAAAGQNDDKNQVKLGGRMQFGITFIDALDFHVYIQWSSSLFFSISIFTSNLHILFYLRTIFC